MKKPFFVICGNTNRSAMRKAVVSFGQFVNCWSLTSRTLSPRWFSSALSSQARPEFQNTRTNWADILAEGYFLDDPVSNAGDSQVPMDTVIKRLERFPESSSFIRTLRKISASEDSSSKWPGLLALHLGTAATGCRVSVNGSLSLHQRNVAKATNYLYTNLLCQEEFSKIHSCRRTSTDFSVPELVNNLFVASAVRVLGQMDKWQVMSEFSKVLEFCAAERQAVGRQTVNGPRVDTTPEEWESTCFRKHGHLVATACRAMLRMSGCDAKIQELGYQFGRIFALAAEAQQDIQQIMDYRNSIRSFFRLSSLPVTLHLETTPQTLKYVHQYRKRMDNIDLRNIYVAVCSSSSILSSKAQLQEYVYALSIISREFSNGTFADNIQRAIDGLSNISE